MDLVFLSMPRDKDENFKRNNAAHNMIYDLHGHVFTPEHLPCGHGINYCCVRHRKHRIEILMFWFCPVHCDVECLTER